MATGHEIRACDGWVRNALRDDGYEGYDVDLTAEKAFATFYAGDLEVKPVSVCCSLCSGNPNNFWNNPLHCVVVNSRRTFPLASVFHGNRWGCLPCWYTHSWRHHQGYVWWTIFDHDSSLYVVARVVL
jgi:hypothetical protein